jgi:hypothetical protein
VIPIPKPGRDHSNPSHYRASSLLSSISKILERVILKRLNAFISSHNVLLNHQFGFRAHQLNRVVRHVRNRRASPRSMGVSLLHSPMTLPYKGGSIFKKMLQIKLHRVLNQRFILNNELLKILNRLINVWIFPIAFKFVHFYLKLCSLSVRVFVKIVQ